MSWVDALLTGNFVINQTHQVWEIDEQQVCHRWVADVPYLDEPGRDETFEPIAFAELAKLYTMAPVDGPRALIVMLFGRLQEIEGKVNRAEDQARRDAEWNSLGG